MPVKRLEIPDIGAVVLSKRRGARSLRLTIGAGGIIRVTLPPWVPYKMGVDFVLNKHDWIKHHRPQPSPPLQDGDHIGKAHRLKFVDNPLSSRINGRINDGEVRVTYGFRKYSWQCADVQLITERTCIRALKIQSEQLLPIRTRQLANKYGFTYKSVTIKQLRARWGSCNNLGQLTFNLFLIQLPWQLIDYVIMHELQHTVILKHGPHFWSAMKRHTPEVAAFRKAIKQHQPQLLNANALYDAVGAPPTPQDT